MARQSTIKMKLLQGVTAEELIAQGYLKQSVMRAEHELENGVGVGADTCSALPPLSDFDEHLDPQTKSTTQQYESLAIAIISTAVFDLADCYILRHHGNASVESRISTIEKWFYNEAIYLTEVSPDVMIQAARMRAESKIKGTNEIRGHRYYWVNRDSYTTDIDYRRKEQKQKNG